MQPLQLDFGITHLLHPLTKLLVCPIKLIGNVLDHLLEKYFDVRAQRHGAFDFLLAHFDVFCRLTSPLENRRVADDM